MVEAVEAVEAVDCFPPLGSTSFIRIIAVSPNSCASIKKYHFHPLPYHWIKGIKVVKLPWCPLIESLAKIRTISAQVFGLYRKGSATRFSFVASSNSDSSVFCNSRFFIFFILSSHHHLNDGNYRVIGLLSYNHVPICQRFV